MRDDEEGQEDDNNKMGRRRGHYDGGVGGRQRRTMTISDDEEAGMKSMKGPGAGGRHQHGWTTITQHEGAVGGSMKSMRTRGARRSDGVSMVRRSSPILDPRHRHPIRDRVTTRAGGREGEGEHGGTKEKGKKRSCRE